MVPGRTFLSPLTPKILSWCVYYHVPSILQQRADSFLELCDGFCSSACTMFSEFMSISSGVKSIAMGGRPSTNPTQGVGGVKGSLSINWNYIYGNSRSVYSQATPELHAILANLTALPMQRSTRSGVNLRDSILRPNVHDGLPTQFVYEAADCRLFWTPPMVIDVRAVWMAVPDATWPTGLIR
jgi:hypothetical protein